MTPTTTAVEAPRIGLSGCGTIGALHAKNLAAAGVAPVFHNRTRTRADDFARRFGGRACGDYGDLLQRCDAVVVATPPGQHLEAVLAALAAGRPVLVEKPLCGTREELERIEAAAAAAADGAFVMVAENYYYKPSLAWLREVVTWAGVGAVTSIQARKLTRQVTAGWKREWGALLEGGIHFVALVADLADAAGAVVEPAAAEEAAAAAESGAPVPPPATPAPPGVGGEASAGGRSLGLRVEEPPEAPNPLRRPLQVRAEFPTATRGAAERQARLQLSYDDGLDVRLHYAWDVPSLTKGIFQHSRVDGEAGRIWFESNGLYAHLRGPGRKGWTFPGFGDLMGYGAMTADFLRCVAAVREGGAPVAGDGGSGAATGSGAVGPYSSLARARRDLEIVWRAYEQLPQMAACAGPQGRI